MILTPVRFFPISVPAFGSRQVLLCSRYSRRLISFRSCNSCCSMSSPHQIPFSLGSPLSHLIRSLIVTVRSHLVFLGQVPSEPFRSSCVPSGPVLQQHGPFSSIRSRSVPSGPVQSHQVQFSRNWSRSVPSGPFQSQLVAFSPIRSRSVQSGPVQSH